MKKYLFALSILFLGLKFSYLKAQCPTNIIFLTQAEVDDFPTNYPNCTNITGDVTIGGSGVTNLNGLVNLNSIGGYLYITSSSLNDLSGLDNLTSIGGQFYFGSTTFVDLNGFPALTSIGDDLEIRYNDNLTVISGLNALTMIGDASGDDLYIQNNSSLNTISGLNTLGTVFSSIYIRDNPVLADISGLSMLSSVGSSFYLEDTQILNLSSLSSISTIPAQFSISNNDNLSDLSGLPSSFTYVGILRISDNDNLSDLSGLPLSLTFPSWGDFIVSNNNSLLNLSGLPVSFSNINIEIKDNDALLSLSGLDELSSVSNLSIGGNANLIDLSGLPSQSSIEGLLIYNTNLSDLSGLPSYNSVSGNLNISSNSNLNDISSLSSITSTGSLIINNNNLLSNLNPLNSITSLNNGYLNVQNNNNLTSLEGLGNIDYNTIQRIFLTINPNLSICELQNICDFLDSGGLNTITGNATGCATLAEIQTACQNPLPVELVFFRSFVQNETIKLSWQTSSELNNLGFEVHKSQDGKNWSNISWVNGKATNTGVNDYQIIDQNPFSGLNYYRLKQVDFDGHFEYSDIVSTEYQRDNIPISIFPNPSNNYLIINDLGEDANSIIIFDSLGKKVMQTEIRDNSTITFDIGHLTMGTYFIQISSNHSIISSVFTKI